LLGKQCLKFDENCLLYSTDSYKGIQIDTYFSLNLFQSLKLQVRTINGFKRNESLLIEHPFIGTFGLGREGGDGYYGHNIIESLKYEYDIIFRFYEFYFGDKEGYLLITRESIKDKIRMVHFQQDDNLQYRIKLDRVEFRNSFEIDFTNGLNDFSININSKNTKLIKNYYTLLCSKLSQLLQSYGFGNHELTQKLIQNENHITFEEDNYDTISALRKLMHVVFVRDIDQIPELLNFTNLLYKCSPPSRNNTLWCFGFEGSTINELGMSFFYQRILIIDNSLNRICISQSQSIDRNLDTISISVNPRIIILANGQLNLGLHINIIGIDISNSLLLLHDEGLH